MLYFASQGAGRLIWPVASQFLRLVVAGGSQIVLRLGGGLTGVFVMAGLALAVFRLGVTASISQRVVAPAMMTVPAGSKRVYTAGRASCRNTSWWVILSELL